MSDRALLWESPGIRAARARGENVGRPDEGEPILGWPEPKMIWPRELPYSRQKKRKKDRKKVETVVDSRLT